MQTHCHTELPELLVTRRPHGTSELPCLAGVARTGAPVSTLQTESDEFEVKTPWYLGHPRTMGHRVVSGYTTMGISGYIGVISQLILSP